MAASTLTVFQGNNVFCYNVRGVFNASDETDTVVIDLSAKAGPNGGVAPTKLRIDEIFWTINGYNYIMLEFDRTTDVVIDYFAGQGYMDYSRMGGKIDNGTGNTGDLLLTSAGGASGGNFSFLIKGRFKQ